MISSLLHLVGLRPRVYYTLTNFRGGGQGPLGPPPSIRQCIQEATYRLINANRRLTAHGGLIIYIHNDFEFKELNEEFLLHIHVHLIHLKVCLSKFGERTTVIKNTLLETFTDYHYTTRTT